jgi:hypothetical protein
MNSNMYTSIMIQGQNENSWNIKPVIAQNHKFFFMEVHLALQGYLDVYFFTLVTLFLNSFHTICEAFMSVN